MNLILALFSFSRKVWQEDYDAQEIEVSIETVTIHKSAFDLMVAMFMDAVAGPSGGKQDSARAFAAAVQECSGPLPEKLIDDLIGYAVHHDDRRLAEMLSTAFRGTRTLRFEESAIFGTNKSFEIERRMSDSIDRKLARLGRRHP